MIGRFDHTPDRRRVGHQDGPGRRIVGGFLLLAILGASALLAAQVAKAQAPAARKKAAPAASPGGMALPGDPPRLDPHVIPAESTADGDPNGNPLPGAKPAPGGSAPASGQSGSGEPHEFALQPDRLNPGKQRVQVAVEVQASPVINIGKESTVRLVVSNEGANDAHFASVVYQKPDGIDVVSTTPEATKVPGSPSLFYWKKPMLAANGEWVIVLKVVAREAKPCEHAATVTAKAGSRAVTTVQEPKLKVEATATPGRVLIKDQVTYQIAVTNPGTGPARNVIVQAKLTGGLKLGSDDIVEQTIDLIEPGKRVQLDPLILDTVAGGQQAVTVEVRSPDVNLAAEDHRVTRGVEVTQPELAVKLSAPESRFTGQINEYKLTVSNPGTAPARKVKVTVALPREGGRLKDKVPPPGARLDPTTRKLTWTLPQLDVGQAVDLAFEYETSTPGLYRCLAEASSGVLRKTDQVVTDVSGIAALNLEISQSDANRIIDVGKTTYYQIRIKNVGSKEATRVQLSGTLTKNLEFKTQYGVDRGEVKFNRDSGAFIFPEIDRIAPNQEMVLGIDVLATKKGSARCEVKLAHAEMDSEDGNVVDVITTTVTGSGPSPRPAANP